MINYRFAKMKETNEDGFSLVELMVVVGLLSILSMMGVAGYSDYNGGQEQRTVDLASQSLLNVAIQAHKDYDENTTVELAIEEWQETVGVGQDISVESEAVEGCVRVRAISKSGFIAERENGYNCDGNSPFTFPPAEPIRYET